MKNYNSRPAIFLGVFLIGFGLFANKWIFEAFFSSDGNIESSQTTLLIAIIQILLIGIGVYLAVRKPRINIPTRKELALISVATLIAIILIETTLRIWLNFLSTDQQFRTYALYTDIPSEDYQWSSHHYLNHYPTPNYRNGLTYHNSLGYRNREFSAKKPDNIYRIAILGGSSTYTTSVIDNEDSFPYELERILREDYGTNGIEVINAGVGGYNSWESLINLQIRVLDIDPDFIIVYHGTNDVHTRLVLPDAYKGDNSGRRKQWSSPNIPFTEHSLLLRVISRKLGLTGQVGLGSFVNASTFFGAAGGKWRSEKDNAGKLLEQNPPLFFRRNLTNMVAIARANNVSIGFATWAHSPNMNDYAANEAYQHGFRENNEVVQEVAIRHDAYLFDFASVMPKDAKYWADGRHVNEEGALLKATLFAEFIRSSGVLE